MRKAFKYTLFAVSALMVLVWLCLGAIKAWNKGCQVSPLSKYYFTDGKGVFFRESSGADDRLSNNLLLNKHYLEDADPESFVVLDDNLARDKSHLFCRDSIVSGVDLNTLKVKDGMVYDKDYVYEYNFLTLKKSDIRVNTKKLRQLANSADDNYQYWTDDSRIYAYMRSNGLEILDTLRQPLDTINSSILRNGNNIICYDTIVPFDTIKSITRLERNYVKVNDSIVRPNGFFTGSGGVVSKEEYEKDISIPIKDSFFADPSFADKCIVLIVYLVSALFACAFFTIRAKLPMAMRIANAFILAPVLYIPFVLLLTGMVHFPPYSIDSFQRLLFFTLDYYAVFLFQIVYGAKQVHLRFQKPLLTALYYPLGIAAFILFYSLVFWVERL
ncbi:MAG: DKNYY domain-containing protein [Bacteroidaceae bacterium]|nr:DKNYY domain-containing protein [Bacteroidaceae bacterium]